MDPGCFIQEVSQDIERQFFFEAWMTWDPEKYPVFFSAPKHGGSIDWLVFFCCCSMFCNVLYRHMLFVLWCCQLYNFTCPNYWSILVQNFFNVQILIISLISHHFQFQVNIRMSSWGYSHDPPSGPKRVRQNSWLRRSIQCQAEIRWDSSHRCHGETMGKPWEILGGNYWEFHVFLCLETLWFYGNMGTCSS